MRTTRSIPSLPPISLVLAVAVLLGSLTGCGLFDRDPGERVLIVGDSVTFMSSGSLKEDFSWADEVDIKAVSGLRTDELLPFAEEGMTHDPSSGVFMPGYNDVLQGRVAQAKLPEMMDLAAETSNFDLPTVTRLQQLKTGALIAFSVEAGAILARIPPEGRTPLRGYARDIGLAFQIADDIMDVEGDENLAGKALHKDDAAGKATFVTLMGIERAREQATALVEQAIAHLSNFGEEAALLRAIARYVVERDR